MSDPWLLVLSLMFAALVRDPSGAGLRRVSGALQGISHLPGLLRTPEGPRDVDGILPRRGDRRADDSPEAGHRIEGDQPVVEIDVLAGVVELVLDDRRDVPLPD